MCLANIYMLSMAFLQASQKCLSKHLQSLNKLCSSESGFLEPLQAYKWLCNGQNILPEHQRTLNRLCSSQNMYHHPPQRFNRLHGTTQSEKSIEQALRYLKLICRISTSIKPACSSQNWVIQVLQAVNRICCTPN